MSVSRGIDVSEHQGTIDWERVKPQIDFAMLRVGYGRNHIDRQFVRNAQECTRLGIPFGGYWFSYALNAEQAKAEADYCVAALSPYKAEYPVAFDFEYDSAKYAAKQGVTLTPSLVQSMASAFLLEIEAAGYFAANYANPDYINRYFGAALQKRFGLWLASWPKGSVNANKPPVGCVMWQWGSSNVDGITGGVDSNFCYTSFAAKAVPAQASAEVPQVVPAWKLEIADKALAAGIITDEAWKDKLDEAAPVWMVLALANKLKGDT